MRDELEELATDLGKNRPEVRDILERSEVFRAERERYIRLLKGLSSQEKRDWLNRRVFDEFCGAYPPSGESYLIHKLTAATTGAGKSMSAFLEVCALIERNVNVIIFDYQNQFTDLGLLYPDKLYVAWLDMLRINLLERCGRETPEEVAGGLVAKEREDFYFRDMSENIFFQEAVRVMKKYGLNATIYHLIKDLSALLQRINVRERSHGAIVTILNRLNRLVTELPGTFSCLKGFPVEFLLSKSIIFPLQGVSIYLANFLVNHIIGLIMKNKKPSESPEIVFVIDECQNYINRQREARMDLGELFIYSALRMSRKLGIGFYLLSQTMSTFSAAILANTNSIFVGRMLNGP
ncbi:MAG: DUF87 domain-containing protein [Candidatus Aenigmarchaeota archaeon]|nr:DUF87 domain-containing protein [Candidatus Aenigmarchaeota archaeon]